jgi:eukaryotic-like serine/threonine-protein kinase
MDRERFQRAAELFEGARGLAVTERERFVCKHAGDDTELRDEVLALLRHYQEEGPSDSLDRVAKPGFTLSALRPEPATEEHHGRDGSTPDSIGRYRVVRKLAEGGMGIVYLAEQDLPRREVAVKLIKPGMDSAAVIARFEQEREALAVIDHPNVAKVLDAGTTDRGLPYFVMEHVRGIPITEFCDQHRLSIEDRLKLFIGVCEAVQHAHTKGVIHRDLKPSNILVVEAEAQSPAMRMPGLSAIPKVIDFGIAKALNQRLTERTIFTEQGQMIGTPEYMSPEQAGGMNLGSYSSLDIDTRADVYSLGVVLYELLTGALPFDSQTLRAAGFTEIQRIIREVEPRRPSAKFLSPQISDPDAIARSRSTDVRMLARRLIGDLDWIVMKCLEKDRERRYDAVNGLSADLRRHLSNEPVLAGPPSTVYRLRKFIRRNRVPVAAGSLVAAALVMATIVSVTYALAEAEHRRIADLAQTQAKQRAAELEQVVEFQQARLSGIDVPMMGVRMRLDLLERSREHLSRSLDDQQEIDAALVELDRIITGVNFTDVARTVLEENIFDQALTAIDEQFAEQPLVKARLLRTIAITLQELGLRGRAVPLLEEALDIRRQELGNEHVETMTSVTDMGYLHYYRGRLEDAEPYFREALEARRHVLGEEHPHTLRSFNTMSDLLIAQSNFVEAEWYVREAYERTKRVLGDDDRETHHSINNMGLALEWQGKRLEAEPYYREVLELRRRVLGDEHPHTLHSMNNMGYLLRQMGNLDEAEVYYRQTLEARRRALGDEHPSTLLSVINLGGLLMAQNKFSDAEPYYREALEGSRRALGEDHQQTLVAIHNMGTVLSNLGELEEAEQYGRDAVQRARDVLPADHWHLAVFLSRYGNTLVSMERFDEAETHLLEALTIFEAALGPDHDRTISVITQLADLYDAWHEHEPDAGHDERAAEWRARLPKEDETE